MLTSGIGLAFQVPTKAAGGGDGSLHPGRLGWPERGRSPPQSEPRRRGQQLGELGGQFVFGLELAPRDSNCCRALLDVVLNHVVVGQHETLRRDGRVPLDEPPPAPEADWYRCRRQDKGRPWSPSPSQGRRSARRRARPPPRSYRPRAKRQSARNSCRTGSLGYGCKARSVRLKARAKSPALKASRAARNVESSCSVSSGRRRNAGQVKGTAVIRNKDRRRIRDHRRVDHGER